MAETKRCQVCGKEFNPCNTCHKHIPEELQWRRVVCCEEHFNYHLPIIQYVRGKVDKTTAKNQLTDAIEKYGKVEFCDNIKTITEEILAEDITTELNETISISLNKTEDINEFDKIDYVAIKTANKKNKKNN